jgi:hypothetical protein
MGKRAGISKILVNNHKIANNKQTEEYFGKTPSQVETMFGNASAMSSRTKAKFVPRNNL